MNTKLSESNGEPCTWRHVSTVRGQALENLPSKNGKALSAEPTHIIFPSAIRYVDLGAADLLAAKADGTENVLRVKAALRDFSRESNLAVITEDGAYYTFNVWYADEPVKFSIEMTDFIHDGEIVNRPNNALDIYMYELGQKSPLLAKLIMKSIYKNNDKEIKHIGSKRFGI